MNEKVAAKLDRLQKAVRGTGLPDRVPVGDNFWTGYLLRERELRGESFDPYLFHDLDYVIVTPNMDPRIRDFEVLEDDGVNIRLRTGFGATIRRSGTAPMPHFDSFSVNEPEEMQDFGFDDPRDPRRFTEAHDDQINGVGDAIGRDTPAWTERLKKYENDTVLFGSVCEAYEYLWRCIGTVNSLTWPLEEPEMFGDFVGRIGDFLCDFTRAQIEYGGGKLKGMFIWGDVAYVNGMLFSPKIWRTYFKPITKRLIDICHEAGLMVVYHGCGNATAIYEDFIDMGLDAYNPLECKSHLDMVELRERFGYRLGFVGNIDVREMESGDRNRIKREVLHKLTGAVEGRWVAQSDHSVSSGVAPEGYAYMLEVVREYGVYPLDIPRITAEIARLDALLA